MNPLARRLTGLMATLWTLSLVNQTLAQIVVGQTAGFTGAVAASVKEATDGAKLYKIGRAHV